MNKVSQWATDDARWQAIVERNKDANGHFVYGVRTTGVYCQPSGAARLPKRENIEFFDTPEAAEAQGYRPSKRLRRGQPELETDHSARIAEACRYIEACEGEAALADIAVHVGMSTFHFHRLFKSITGLTPKAYASAHRNQRLREALNDNVSVTDAIFDAGFNSNSRFYENSSAMLGMTPKTWRAGGKGTTIYFALGICSLGDILVAQSDKGICAILLGEDPDALLKDLQDKFPQADLVGGDADFEKLVARVVGFVEAPELGLDLPLDIRGTAFQQRVWQALRDIPVGATVSYSDIALRIGSPRAVRAVAGACAANMLAVAIPCHRVVKNDGALSGYRWGVERKRALLNKEAKVS
ncbi:MULTISPECIES: bifunctional DNA-binding transcriptional regulator/O6-methylguanine-DNA methyltransferase Ada [Enterobacterales]|uniref:bifunctional DNA-binding transcriptional regulator/O6-methylguanine-DNA methyltransferase Ada n=1 Tax=Enterobacterales TaxID=91347 RepID=UPI0024AF4005|nr:MULTISPECIES: bifunctional DNA-binding transcriptional regulator/O6-methylguanine-DNA methyltransferase Ada [Enterobacterales]MDI6934688.1 bifunctional DNA-binding transcriptional regulator/O6-methylguanine-DNA methyltransferase Ada [Serratia sp. Se-PFBMAAmG]MDI9225795.1 bifunctional DNA-binding transcriptional regulator/O6-methylguanine-DNA methyltransferase Ada [Serratia bockelmannii]MDI6948966.1 bifunctional DNA-binding transcriptional regulator/O6-methylguanine-DNA methyltransferase Ada [